MFQWLFRKRAAKIKAIDGYLAHFDAGELAYLKNITLLSLMPSEYESCRPLPDSAIVDLATHIHAAWLAATGEIEATPLAQASVRMPYRVLLARDMTRRSPGDLYAFLGAISPHRLEEPELSSEQEDRLGAHSIMLNRIYADPVDAPSLPELEAINEGLAWRR